MLIEKREKNIIMLILTYALPYATGFNDLRMYMYAPLLEYTFVAEKFRHSPLIYR